MHETDWIGGVDEAGRGPLAGPVYAACVILGPDCNIEGLADSKKLSESKRTYLAALIKHHAKAWAIASASVAEIDHLNILQASLLAMKRAVERLPLIPSIVLVDGNQSPRLNCPMKTIIKGDSLVPEISAASILAKTARDAEMLRLHKHFPVYGLNQHKGYPTKAHLAALRQHGISEIHRRSFAPVSALMGEHTHS
ncbi:ribonuclease HII [Nitrosomonas sp. Nm58]|uniref:ribonuclease HII n=1 Tax=Nitrosomonas sp. Nm58 TaxID=200126 RepID=UPI0008994DE2|nr:ribonuclease HII [Nitrosomonas sp. Nm58]SDY07742.1 RNase HII [Nitrosomonas sp. Nm58]